MTDRSRSPQSRLLRVSLESSSDHTDSDGDSSPSSGSSNSTSSSSSAAGPLERAQRQVILVLNFKALFRKVLVRFPKVLPVQFHECVSCILWHIPLTGVVNLRTGDLKPHVTLSATQMRHVSGWGQQMASRAGSLAQFLHFQSTFTVNAVCFTHGWLGVLSLFFCLSTAGCTN